MAQMHLEDYLELVSFLPQEFCDRLTKVRELDLDASNRRDNIERLKERISPQLFAKGRTAAADAQKDAPSQAEKTAITTEIAAEYDQIVLLGVEKVKIITELEDLMLKYNRRLQVDTEKFKMDLLIDGSPTEHLETRAEQEMANLRDNAPLKSSLPEARASNSRKHPDMGHYMAMQRQKQQGGKNSFTAPLEHHSSSSHRRVNVPYGGTNMLRQAASQAIAATQNLPTGRRTASLKASYEASVRDTPTMSRDHSMDRNDGFMFAQNRKRQSHRKIDRFADDDDSEAGNAVDEDNQLYCFCRLPSSGFMIACDNSNCKIEWYHGACVNVSSNSVESGMKWYCPTCTADMARDRERGMKSGGRGMFNNTMQHYKQHDPHHHPGGSSGMKMVNKKHRRPQ